MSSKTFGAFALSALVLLTPGIAIPDVAPLPEGQSGIAARYPGDKAIAEDTRVVFTEDFEEIALEALLARWTSASNKDGRVLSFSDDVPVASSGKQSLCMTATKGHNTGGHMWKLFEPGEDVLFARFYVKFSTDHPYVHHLVQLGAHAGSPREPRGGAGRRPAGEKGFRTGLECNRAYGRYPPPGVWFLYTYWHEMRSWQGGDGTSFYGNDFTPEPVVPVKRGRWQCVEFMLKANSTPDGHDGEQAFWIDGKIAGRWGPGVPTGKWIKDRYVAGAVGEPFGGYNFRTDDELKINTFWLLYYMAAIFDDRKQVRPEREMPYNPDLGRVWFDDIVLAREYIGPVSKP